MRPIQRLTARAAFAAALWPAFAAAQAPSVDPTPADTPALPDDTPPPPPPATAPGGTVATPPAQGAQGAEGEGSFNIHYDEYLDDDDFRDREDGAVRGRPLGAVPPVHEVQSGDTLWDISGTYFGDSWQWPRVWSYNPQITNPHWIYPGDEVRLREAGAAAQADAPIVDVPGEGDLGLPVAAAAPSRRRGVMLRQMAFVDAADLEGAPTIHGSTREKMLLADGDEVYIAETGDAAPLEVGARYAVYREKQPIEHPVTGDALGAYVEILGEVEMRSRKDGKHARALILGTTDVIERGMRVGPVRTQFKSVEPRSASQSVEGMIVAQIEGDHLIGAAQAVILDRGSEHGVAPGHRFYVVRRGDAYSRIMQPGNNVGQNDESYPARAIGEILVVDVGASTSLGLVTMSLHEFSVGDRVLLPADAGR